MIRHRIEVERLLQLEIEAPRMGNRLAPGKAIGIVGCGERAKRVRIEGIGRVDVEVAEECQPVRVGLSRGRSSISS